MIRQDFSSAVLLCMVVSLLSVGGLRQCEAQKSASDQYARCAKACIDCRKACTACSKHCVSMVAAGMKEHVKSKSLADDCADICAAAANITARRGPMSAAICAACAKACDACGAECRKWPAMEPMKYCAQSCSDCAKACREMLKS